MTRKRKIARRLTAPDRTPLQTLRFIGERLNHPLIINDLEPKTYRGQEVSPSPDVKRIMCFAGIPSCVLSSKGTGARENLADESAAHAMLDFFRLAVSPEFVNKLCACKDDDAVLELLPQVTPVFEQFDKAISVDFLSINRCTQLEMSPSSLLRGREIKKRVLVNTKNPSVGYELEASTTPKPNRKKDKLSPNETTQDESNNGTSNELITISSGDSRSSSCSADIIIVSENIKVRKMEPMSPIKSPSPQVESMRKVDDAQKSCMAGEFVRQSRDRREEGIDSSTYFGQINTSNQGPADVFCCLPDPNPVRYNEDPYSDDSEDEGEKAVPSKRARTDVDETDNEVIILNTSSASLNPLGEASTSGESVLSKKNPESRVKDSDEEIGDMVDEWDENDDIEILEQDSGDQEVTTTTSPTTAQNGRLFDGHPNHQSFMKAHGLSVHYQAKTIGVVVNKKLSDSVERFVESVCERSLDSVKKLSSLAWDHYRHNTQSDATYNKKMNARQTLLNEIQQLFPDKFINLQVTGSTINGCGAFNSDVDMCLCYPTNSYRGYVFDDFGNDRSNSTKVLRKLDRAIKRTKYGQPLKNLIYRCEMIPAKVPIIKLKLNGIFKELEVDINVNNIAGIYNSHLTHYYSLVDARFPVLALLVKHWAGANYINNAQAGYLNSYTVILLVVHFLQCGVSPAVLPNLQYVFPDKFDKKLPLDELLLYGDISDKLPVSVPNTWSLGELFIGFFHYYSNFDFEKYAISIRSGQVVPRSLLPRDTANYPMFIEEPFDAINTARSVRTSEHMKQIKREIRKGLSVFNAQKFTMRDLRVAVWGDT
ncbi:hypothetical protein CRE_20741 [Caenorhabditis remanei]|uniref:Uncharacterized protein n=2 Tax=Caenorhabditis remanei TaxID=31234 RepID=E3MFC2_CAERE|nr:hypothetical protein CRE_20741 [Caenorhabditis remanei]